MAKSWMWSRSINGAPTDLITPKVQYGILSRVYQNGFSGGRRAGQAAQSHRGFYFSGSGRRRQSCGEHTGERDRYTYATPRVGGRFHGIAKPARYRSAPDFQTVLRNTGRE